MPKITVSVVLHGHGVLLTNLLDCLLACEEVSEVIITFNIPEPELSVVRSGRVRIIENDKPRGFSENHNSAFKIAKNAYFAVVNPDIIFDENPFPDLLNCLKEDNAAMVAPAVVNRLGSLEDSARQFPTLANLFLKALGLDDGRIEYSFEDKARKVPWVAGMFMLFKSQDFADLSGFDERYFLYYEDVDICARLWKRGRKVMLCPSAHVVHDAQRASHRNLKHMMWHMKSMVRYLKKYATDPLLRDFR